MLYLWIKILHILAIISWMAGILYLYRLLIYRVERGSSSAEVDDLLKLMAERLYRYITVPAMSVAYLAGFGMLYLNPGMFSSGWLHVKLASVLILTVFTIYAGKLNRRMAGSQAERPTSKRLRFFNEVPTLAMVIIVIMVILKPF